MKRLLLAIFLIIAMLLVGCGNVSTTNSEENTDEISSSENSQSSPPADTTFEIPGTLSAENFDIKIVSAEICESLTLDGGGVDIPVEADDGKQFLVLSIDATNTSDELRNLGSFATYVDSVTVLPSNYLGKYGDRVVFVGAVHPEKTICTYILYQVPTEWKEFELSYVDSLSYSASKTIKIFRSDLS